MGDATLDSTVVRALSSIGKVRTRFEERASSVTKVESLCFGRGLSGRLIHANSDYSISLFWFDQRVALEVWHTHPEKSEEIVLIRGSINVILKGEAARCVVAPHAVLIPPNVEHRIEAAETGTKGCSVLIVEEP